MRRKQATKLIDELRALSSEAALLRGLDLPREQYNANMARLMARVCIELHSAGLGDFEACPGGAHSNPHIDNCSHCAPRWGWVGPVEVIS